MVPTADEWAARYRQGTTPWDLGVAHPELVARLASGALGPPGRVLVPGCGRGHDALALAAAGWEVTAVDVVEDLRPMLAGALEERGGRFVLGDALDPAVAGAAPFDLLFDHTFFCALPPEQRPAFGVLASATVAAGGLLVSLVFPVDRPADLGGPPWCMTVEALAETLEAEFRLTEDAPPAPAPGRRWKERWAQFERAAGGGP
jgi:SAM-dependent methyltransferase